MAIFKKGLCHNIRIKLTLLVGYLSKFQTMLLIER